jgi:hypothetical protein
MKLLSSKQELNDCLLNIIKDSQETLKIVSPFVDFYDKKNKQKWGDLIELLKGKESILEIYTKPKSFDNKSVDYITKALKPAEDRIIPIHYLHAKIYMNDDTILLSSMNLTYPSFNRSIEFGVIIKKNENEEEYKAVLDYCNKYIFIYNKINQEAFKKDVVNYFYEKNIEAKFYDNNCLYLVKNKKYILRCYFDLLHNDKNMALHLDVGENDTDEILSKCKVKKRTGRNSTGIYYILKKNECGIPALISTIRIYKEEILETIMDVCNCITEQNNHK